MLSREQDKVFGKNDIRGIVKTEGISAYLFRFVARAYARYVFERLSEEEKQSLVWVSVGFDARNHSEELKNAVLDGLSAMGINVLDIGMCPTPFGYFSEVALTEPYEKFSKVINREKKHINVGTLIITASHNPSEYNGLKMTFKGLSLDENEILKLKKLTNQEMDKSSPNAMRYGFIKKYDMTNDYTHKVLESFARVENIKIVTDCGNATAGVVAPALYREMGCDVVELFTEPDGDFPNHHPNPSEVENLKDLMAKVVETKADFGLAFDGDTDRLGVVDDTGKPVPGDVLLLIFALDIIESLKGRAEIPTIVSEVKCSQIMYDTINREGGNAIMWKTGHGFIKSKMRETQALLAGEMSGHIFFKDRYYGFDDAVYAGCRFVEILAKKRLKNPDIKVSDIIRELKIDTFSSELRHKCPDELKQPALAKLKEMIEADNNIFGSPIKEIITIDGMRIIFEDGFALIRASNTEPVYTMRFEATTEAHQKMYHQKMVRAVEECIKLL